MFAPILVHLSEYLYELYHFYRAACNAAAVWRGDFCPSVRLSICLSVRHTRGLWQNGRKICPDLYTIRKNIYPSFFEKKNGWWGATASR